MPIVLFLSASATSSAPPTSVGTNHLGPQHGFSVSSTSCLMVGQGRCPKLSSEFKASQYSSFFRGNKYLNDTVVNGTCLFTCCCNRGVLMKSISIAHDEKKSSIHEIVWVKEVLNVWLVL